MAQWKAKQSKQSKAKQSKAIPATATHDYIPATSDIPAIPATPAINMPAANQGAFDPITQTLYINLNDTPAFEMAIKLTGITDFSQITLA